MLNSFSIYFKEVASQCIKFMDTIEHIRFNEEDDALELFLMTTINVNINNAKSISLLLDNDQFGSVIMVCRNIIESYFNIHWAYEPLEKEAVKNRVFELEGDTLFHLEKEINLSDEKQLLGEITWGNQKVQEFKKLIETEKTNFPQLLTKNKDGKIIFKHPPPFANRMLEHRLRYYQIYIFTSLFTHPSPKLKEFYLSRIVNENTGLEIVEDALKQTLVFSIYLIQAIIGYAEIVFRDIIPDSSIIRKTCYQEIINIVNNANKGIVDFNKITTKK